MGVYVIFIDIFLILRCKMLSEDVVLVDRFVTPFCTKINSFLSC